MSSPKIAVLGEVLFDSFADDVEVLGGAPFNVAWHLQAFQQPVILMSRIGQDSSGDKVRTAIHAWGMNSECLQRDPVYPTGRVAITLLEGEPQYSILDNQAYDYIDFSLLTPPQSEWLYHGSLALRHASAMEGFLQWRPSYTGKIFFDVNLRAPWWSQQQLQVLLHGVDWLKLNQDELAQLRPAGTNIQDQLQSLFQMFGLSAILLTQGADGAQLYTADGKIFKASPQAASEIVDTVGAGDAFSAICLLGLINDWPYEIIMERAQVFASAILTQRGALVTQPEFYQSFIRQWRL